MTALPLPIVDATPAPHAPRDAEAPLRWARLLADVGRPIRYHLVTLGCPKNTVDSEAFERRLRAFGCQPVAGPRQADVLVVNTCGFIEQSQEESITAILRLAADKASHQVLVAAGCLVTLNRQELAAELPEVDAFFDPREWDAALAAVAGYGLHPHVTVADLEAAEERLRTGEPPARALADLYDARLLPELATAGAREGLPYDIPPSGTIGGRRVSAYLKVSDGCDAPCTFCIIPQIKGRLTSVEAEELVRQARALRAEGAREIVLVAQDLTAYAEDRGRRDALPDLLRRLAEAVPDVWLRLMYAYPGRVSERLIRAMAELPQVVHYLDVPLQHASPRVLRAMRRPANMSMVRRMIGDLRAAMPDIALRTTFIVGFPGETEADVEDLLAFLEEIRFDHVGVFTYSRQERAVSAGFPGQVPERVKRARRRRVMERQQRIALAQRQALVGRECTVLVEGATTARDRRMGGIGPLVSGRSYRDAPEVDGLVIARGHAVPGDFVRVRVTQATPYDLVGEVTGAADPFDPVR
jgi:ribosomal protein S12 methylthiotransferase